MEHWLNHILIISYLLSQHSEWLESIPGILREAYTHHSGCLMSHMEPIFHNVSYKYRGIDYHKENRMQMSKIGLYLKVYYFLLLIVGGVEYLCSISNRLCARSFFFKFQNRWNLVLDSVSSLRRVAHNLRFKYSLLRPSTRKSIKVVVLVCLLAFSSFLV